MQVCDVAYVMLLDQLRREVDLQRLAAIMVRAQGGEADMPTFEEARERLDKMLTADPKLKPDMELRVALGLEA